MNPKNLESAVVISSLILQYGLPAIVKIARQTRDDREPTIADFIELAKKLPDEPFFNK
jgi:hypothetical protein